MDKINEEDLEYNKVARSGDYSSIKDIELLVDKINEIVKEINRINEYQGQYNNIQN